MLGEKVACAAICPTPVYTVVQVQVQCCLSPQQQLHSDFGDFNNKVCHGVNVTTATSILL